MLKVSAKWGRPKSTSSRHNNGTDSSQMFERSSGEKTCRSIVQLRQLEDILLPQRLPRPILTLQQHRSTFQRPQGMPLSCRDINECPSWNNVDGIRQPPLLIIEVFHEMPTQAHHRLRGGPMPMDRQLRPGLDGIQHALGEILQRIPQVQVHPETRRCLGLGGQGIKDKLVDDHTKQTIINQLRSSASKSPP